MKLHEDVKSSRTINRFKTLEDDFRKVHGGRYDYSKVIYHNMKSKVIITCSKHGDFEQSSSSHLSGHGCPGCFNEKRGESKRSNVDEFIKKALKIHKDKYNYDNVDYKNNSTKVIITCPNHEDFEQTPINHLNGAGCPNCANNSRTISIEKFIFKARRVHGNKYNYGKVEYIGALSKVIITCPIHGDFEQKASSHLEGCGCADCGFDKRANNRRSSTEKFIKKALKIHKDKYNYDKVEYIGSNTKVIITCPIHGDFEQSPNMHLSGQGCPKCGFEKGGWSRDKYKDILTILYYLKVEKENYPTVYKIGITSRSVKERYTTESNSIKITTLNEVVYEDGALAWDEEKRILKEFRKYKYRGDKILNNGNTELFVEDILGLDS